MSTVLVTGGAGFIGTHVVHALSADPGRSVVVLDALTYAGNLAGIQPLIDSHQIEFVRGDICDPQCVSEVFTRFDVQQVVHLAAESHVDRSIKGAGPFVQTNVVGTQILLDAAVRQFRSDSDARAVFVHVSTDEVFGDLEADAAPFHADHRYQPSSPYAASKAASDHLVRAWARTYGLPICITNCGNNYGPWQFPEKLIPLMILNAIDERPLPVYGDGQQVRDWIHVSDHARALIHVLDHGSSLGTYLVGANCERSNLYIVKRICELMDAALGRSAGSTAELITFVTDRPGHDRRYALDATSMHQLNWEPSHIIDTALKGVIDWYLNHRDWCDAIRSGEYRSWYEQQYGSTGTE